MLHLLLVTSHIIKIFECYLKDHLLHELFQTTKPFLANKTVLDAKQKVKIKTLLHTTYENDDNHLLTAMFLLHLCRNLESEQRIMYYFATWPRGRGIGKIQIHNFFISRRRKMRPDTADSTVRYNNSNVLPHIPMSPAYILSICNMSIFFVGSSIITICVMLLVSLPSHL